MSINTLCVPQVYRRIELGETESKMSVEPLSIVNALTPSPSTFFNLKDFDLDKLNEALNAGVEMAHFVLPISTTIHEILPDNAKRKVIVLTNIDLFDIIIVSFGTPPRYTGVGVTLSVDQGVPMPSGKSVLLPRGSAPINRVFAGSDQNLPKLSILEGI